MTYQGKNDGLFAKIKSVAAATTREHVVLLSNNDNEYSREPRAEAGGARSSCKLQEEHSTLEQVRIAKTREVYNVTFSRADIENNSSHINGALRSPLNSPSQMHTPLGATKRRRRAVEEDDEEDETSTEPGTGPLTRSKRRRIHELGSGKPLTRSSRSPIKDSLNISKQKSVAFRSPSPSPGGSPSSGGRRARIKARRPTSGKKMQQRKPSLLRKSGSIGSLTPSGGGTHGSLSSKKLPIETPRRAAVGALEREIKAVSSLQSGFVSQLDSLGEEHEADSNTAAAADIETKPSSCNTTSISTATTASTNSEANANGTSRSRLFGFDAR